MPNSPRNPLVEVLVVFAVLALIVALIGAAMATHTTPSRLITIGIGAAIVATIAAIVEQVTS